MSDHVKDALDTLTSISLTASRAVMRETIIKAIAHLRTAEKNRRDCERKEGADEENEDEISFSSEETFIHQCVVCKKDVPWPSSEDGDQPDVCEGCGHIVCQDHVSDQGSLGLLCSLCYQKKLNEEIEEYQSHTSGCKCYEQFSPASPRTDDCPDVCTFVIEEGGAALNFQGKIDVKEPTAKMVTGVFPLHGKTLDAPPPWEGVCERCGQRSDDIHFIADSPPYESALCSSCFNVPTWDQFVSSTEQTKLWTPPPGEITTPTWDQLTEACRKNECWSRSPKTGEWTKTMIHENGETEITRRMPEKTYSTLPGLSIHVNGSSKPKGDDTCPHCDETGKSTVINNDDTMGGCGSGWESMCKKCGKVWYEE